MQFHLRGSVESFPIVERIHPASSARAGLEEMPRQSIGLLLGDPGLPDGDGVNPVTDAATPNVPSLDISIKCDEAAVLFSAMQGGLVSKDQ